MTIGQGAFGCVKRCVHKDTGFVVALKIYQKSQMQSEAQIVALNEEIAVLQHLDHPNICQLYEVIETRTHNYLIMELCQGKNLSHLTKNSGYREKPGVPENELKPIMR